MNYIDLIVGVVVLLFAVAGYFKGALRQLAEIFSMIMAIFVSMVFYNDLASYLSPRISMNSSIANIIAFFLLWMGVQLVFNVSYYFLYPIIPESVRKSKINRILGALPGVVWGALFAALLLTLSVIAPLDANFRSAVLNSKSGQLVTEQTAGAEKYLSNLLGRAVKQSMIFQTVKPNSEESLGLGYKVAASKLEVDEASEKKMLDLVNEERANWGLKPLKMDSQLQMLARAHSKDMFERGYFAHISPDGLGTVDRMKAAKITYQVAGENLALAPNVDLAHEGLMKSPGHRANILTAEFGLVGIGCIDGGSHGKMFSQEFTN